MKFLAPAEDSKNYLRLKDKGIVKGVFRGDPYEFRIHWGGNKSELCLGHSCSYCASGIKPKFRFRLNFLVLDKDVFTPMIFENSWTVYQALRDLNIDYPLESTLVKITRTGSSINDTSYTILPVPNSTLGPALKVIEQTKLLDLKHAAREETKDHLSDVGEPPNFDSNEDIPF